jgi:hypothetical protein
MSLLLSRTFERVMGLDVSERAVEFARFNAAFNGVDNTQLEAGDALTGDSAVRYRVPWFRGFHWWYVPTKRGRQIGKVGADHAPAAPALRVLGRWCRRSC